MQKKFFLGLSPRGFHRVVYWEWGNSKSARTIVCVHGLTRNARDFDRLAEALSDKARVVCVDVAGRGDSDYLGDPALYAYPQYLADMAALLARLDVAEVDWVGTSMGGLMGMMLAAQPRTPIKRLVLNDVGPFLPAAALERIATYIGNVPPLPDRQTAMAHFRRIYQNTGPCTDEDFENLVENGVKPAPDGRGFVMKYDHAIVQNFSAIKGDVNLWPVYEQIQCPVLLLRGEISDVLMAETAHAMTLRGPRARLITIPKYGHYPALMDVEQIGAVREFLTL